MARRAPAASFEVAKNGNDFKPISYGPYRLLAPIAKGGMAEIFLASSSKRSRLPKYVAIKRMLAQLSEQALFHDMFIGEAKMAAQLQHPNIVEVYELGRHAEQLYIVMEYIDGVDLHRFLRELSKKKVALPLPHALWTLDQTLSALEYSHRAVAANGQPLHIVHRDVSPSNVLLSFNGHIKLCDFGIAKALGLEATFGEPEMRQVLRREVIGKSAYMSPEHVRGEAVDPRSDVYSMGVVAWELCSGRRMYRGAAKDILQKVKRGSTPPFPKVPIPNVGDLAEVIERALKPDPAERWQSANAMREALARYCQQANIEIGASVLEQFMNIHLDTIRVDPENYGKKSKGAPDTPRGNRKSTIRPLGGGVFSKVLRFFGVGS